MTRRWIACLFAVLVLSALPLGVRPAQGDDAGPQDEPKADEPKADEAPGETKNPFPGRFRAPSLDGGTEWLNTKEEININDLRGKVVLIDFWTYCCINCMHVLPDLKFLEQKYPNEPWPFGHFKVIARHSIPWGIYSKRLID